MQKNKINSAAKKINKKYSLSKLWAFVESLKLENDFASFILNSGPIGSDKKQVLTYLQHKNLYQYFLQMH